MKTSQNISLTVDVSKFIKELIRAKQAIARFSVRARQADHRRGKRALGFK